MSWWVGVEGEDTDDADRNVTYNVSPLLCTVLPGDGGLRALDGAPCTEAAGVVVAAAERLAVMDPAEAFALVHGHGNWGSPETALADLRWLADACMAHPSGTIYVH